MRHVTPIALKWESCQVIQKCKCKKNKQTNKRESWSHHAWTVSLWPFWQFDVIKTVPFSVLSSVECTRNFVFAWYMFKDRLCFNNLDKSFDISNWFIPLNRLQTDGNYNLWRRYVVIDFISDFSSFGVVWLIEKKKKKKTSGNRDHK